jgi:hypothetical protein
MWEGSDPQLVGNVLNMSRADITPAIQDTLDLGLSFIPTAKTDRLDLQKAADRFNRSLRLADWFGGTTNSKTKPPFTAKSKWEPPQHKISSLVTKTIQKIDHLANTIPIVKETYNMDKEARQALKTLQALPQIVIKPADKGSATVIQDKEAYIWEAKRQLSNTKHYKKLDQPIYPETAELIKRELAYWRGNILTTEQVKYLWPPEEPRERQLYLLPKIHKKPHTWPAPHLIPPGRPIISDIDSESYNVSQYVDHILGPLQSLHDSYIKDTYDFLEKLKETTIPPTAYLCTCDVQSMFTNIDHTSGLEASRKILEENVDGATKNLTISLLELMLNRNDFKFNGEWYLQNRGTSMGKRWAPAYGDIFMADWESWTLPEAPYQPLFWKRFLDDIFIIWPHSKEEFQEFITYLNQLDESVTLTAEIHETTIDFLDVTVFKGPSFAAGGPIDTKVFFKTTDTHQLLHKKSFHPEHTFASLVKSQIIRFWKICTNKADLDEATNILFKALKKRGYTSRFLKGIKHKTIRELDNPPPQRPTSQRPPGQPKHLETQRGSRPCDNPRCYCCKSITTGQNITKDGITYDIHTELTCKSQEVIYLISCKKCDSMYIGQTKSTLNYRLNQHRYDIRHKKDKPVAQHFNQADHDSTDLQITPIEQTPQTLTGRDNLRHRLTREAWWIQELQTEHPQGMNIDIPTVKDCRDIPLVVKYSSTAVQFSKGVKEIYEQLQESIPESFGGEIITAYSRNTNERDVLVHAKLKDNTGSQWQAT